MFGMLVQMSSGKYSLEDADDRIELVLVNSVSIFTFLERGHGREIAQGHETHTLVFFALSQLAKLCWTVYRKLLCPGRRTIYGR